MSVAKAQVVDFNQLGGRTSSHAIPRSSRRGWRQHPAIVAIGQEKAPTEINS
jgi:hypothetical protein